ncbi:MAG: hypothetical protein AB7G06_07965 [Bdellovibrionales bacterium]
MTVEDRLAAIEARNMRVESDKRWETSAQRRIAICVLTYFVATAWMYSIDVPAPYISASVPVLGYILSTLSLRWLRERFERK